MRTIHNTYFAVHFIFKSLSTIGQIPIYTLRSYDCIYLSISIKEGLLVCTIGDNNFYVNCANIIRYMVYS